MNYDELIKNAFEQIRSNVKSSFSNFLSDFNKGELGVLTYLIYDENPTTAGKLSENLGVSTARVAKILNTLETKNYVKRQIDEKDKRRTLVIITNKGKILAEKSKKEFYHKIKILIDELGIEDFKEYLRLTIKISKITKQF